MNDTPPGSGLIAANIVGFARGLRAAGLPVGPGAVLDALNALRLIDIGRRDEVYTTLRRPRGACRRHSPRHRRVTVARLTRTRCHCPSPTARCCSARTLPR